MAATNVQAINNDSSLDRVRIETRIIAVIIVPILLAAFMMLNLSSDHAHKNFAWGIVPPMSAMMLGSAYVGGAYFFTRVALARRWHTVKLGLLPVTAFASYLGISTIIHWDRFHHNLFAFQLWAFLYLTLPLVLGAVWYRNRDVNPVQADNDYPALPAIVRQFFYVFGALMVIVSLLLLIVPNKMIPTWPWTLSPLTARTMAALFVLPGLVGLGIGRDGRWSAAKIILEAQIISLVGILISVQRANDNYDWGRFVSWLFVGSMVALLVVLVVIYGWMERQHKRAQ